jgi:hypothetical protein
VRSVKKLVEKIDQQVKTSDTPRSPSSGPLPRIRSSLTFSDYVNVLPGRDTRYIDTSLAAVHGNSVSTTKSIGWRQDLGSRTPTGKTTRRFALLLRMIQRDFGNSPFLLARCWQTYYSS